MIFHAILYQHRYLLKRGDVNSAFKKRYFIFQDRIMRYYTNQEVILRISCILCVCVRWSMCDCRLCRYPRACNVFYGNMSLNVSESCDVTSQDANSHTDELGVIPIDQNCSVDAVKDDGGTMHCFELITTAGKRVC